MKNKNIFAALFVFTTALAMVGAAVATTVPVFATSDDLPDCRVQVDGKPCIETRTVSEELNPGLDKETTTTILVKGQNSEIIGVDCEVSAKRAHQGEGQTTGRSC